jgi:paraquat-inducible protein A
LKLLLAVLIVLAPMFFGLGITLPLLTFERLYFFEDNPSLLGLVGTLLEHGDYLLALLVGSFSILFPLFKMVAVIAEAVTPEGDRSGWLARLMPVLSKWSMMDVMLVAIVIAAAKTSGMADAFTEPGLWFYAGSALAITVAQSLVARRAKG